jgi:DNA-binding MarR family transcriptional regulator
VAVAGTSRTGPAAGPTTETDARGPDGPGSDVVGPDAPGPHATDLLIGLLTIGRQVTALAGEERDDTAAVRILYYIGEGDPLRLSDLAAQAGLDHSTVSRHVRRLEDAGYLIRAIDPMDRRAFRLELTERGRQFLEAAIRARAAIVAHAMAGWPEEDRSQLARLVARLATTLEQPPGSLPEPRRRA